MTLKMTQPQKFFVYCNQASEDLTIIRPDTILRSVVYQRTATISALVPALLPHLKHSTNRSFSERPSEDFTEEMAAKSIAN